MATPDKPSYSHGSTGTKPANSQDYENQDPLGADNFDYYLNTLFSKVKSIIDFLDTLDSDGDGTVDAADTAAAVKGNDIDSNGDGIVDEADYANDADASTYKGTDIDSDGDGIVDTADYANDGDASTYKGNDIDSDGDGVVDEADVANNTRTNSEIRTAVDDEVTQAATSVSGLDGQVATNVSDITALEGDLAGYEIQKDGVDGAGIINFKTK